MSVTVHPHIKPMSTAVAIRLSIATVLASKLLLLTKPIFWPSLFLTTLPMVTLVFILILNSSLKQRLRSSMLLFISTFVNSAGNYFNNYHATIYAMLMIASSVGLVASFYLGRKNSDKENIMDYISSLMPAKGLYVLQKEARILLMSLFYWRRKAPSPGVEIVNSHRGLNSVILWTLFPLCILEASVTHLIVSRLNRRISWILLELSLVGALYVFGVAKSLYLQPSRIDNNVFAIRVGELKTLDIKISNIQEVKLWSGSNGQNEISMGLFDVPNILIRLKDPINVPRNNYRMSNLITLHVDHPLVTIKMLEKYI